MSSLYEIYEKLSNEELLRRRGFGHEGLSIEAHTAIEKVLDSRGVTPPPIPSRIASQNSKDSKNTGTFVKILFCMAVLVINEFIIKFLSSHPNALILRWLVILGILVYFASRLFRGWKNTESDRLQAKADKDPTFTELMKCAIVGDISRASELLDYGADIDAQDIKGTTALMYAVSNNQLEMVHFLLERNADVTLKTDAKNTALTFADKYASDDVKNLLRDYRD